MSFYLFLRKRSFPFFTFFIHLVVTPLPVTVFGFMKVTAWPRNSSHLDQNKSTQFFTSWTQPVFAGAALWVTQHTLTLKVTWVVMNSGVTSSEYPKRLHSLQTPTLILFPKILSSWNVLLYVCRTKYFGRVWHTSAMKDQAHFSLWLQLTLYESLHVKVHVVGFKTA